MPDTQRHRYLRNYLQRPQWQEKTWDEIKSSAFLPEDDQALQTLFRHEQEKPGCISTLLNEIRQVDTEIDNRVLDLYGITSSANRQRILGNAPVDEDDGVLALESVSDHENEA